MMIPAPALSPVVIRDEGAAGLLSPPVPALKRAERQWKNFSPMSRKGVGDRDVLGVALGGATGAVGHWTPDGVDQVRLDDLEGAHLLPDAVGAVPLTEVPLGSAGYAVGTAAAGLGGCCCGCGEVGLHLVVEPWGNLGRGGHPAGEVGLEAEDADVSCCAL